MELTKHILTLTLMIELAILFAMLLHGCLHLEWVSQLLRIIYNN
jgi:hypothetical protein